VAIHIFISWKFVIHKIHPAAAVWKTSTLLDLVRM